MSVELERGAPEGRPQSGPDGHATTIPNGRATTATEDRPTVAAAPATAPAPAPAAATRRRPALLTRRVLLPVLAVIVIVVAVFGFNAWREGQLYVSTENAQLSGQPVQVGAMNAGRVITIMPTIGASVHKGAVIPQG